MTSLLQDIIKADLQVKLSIVLAKIEYIENVPDSMIFKNEYDLLLVEKLTLIQMENNY